jgi:tRNA threonylcarbamoyl adenosine modification protein (Sua5/YciO/YrdC/YwlC family)
VIDAVIGALLTGLVVGIPTDTVYGLAVDPRSPGATDLLFALKDRPSTVELPVLVADVEQAEALVGPNGMPSVARQLVARFWPGSLTIVMARRPGLDWDLGGDGGSIGLRCPLYPAVQELCRRVGPLATTSANRHGQPPITTAAGVVDEFGDGVASVLDGGVCDGTPSTVIAVSGTSVRCLRDGAVPWSEVQEVMAPN